MTILHVMMVAALAAAGQTRGAGITDLTWLSGCWELTRGPRHVTESWSSLEGGTLMGVSRTVTDGRTREWEFLVIREGAKGVEYVARPSGQPEATFTATRVSPSEVVFENPAHDFPVRIGYKRDGDALLAYIEGPASGQTRRIEYPYRKAACGGR
jgi:Domain of unknown function (DUF6265)